MSSYFDQRALELRSLRARALTVHSDEVRAWAKTLQLDMAVACEYDKAGPFAFPPAVRDDIYRAFLRCLPEAWPAGVPGYGVDYYYDEDGMRLLSNFVERCHDLFHAAATEGWPGRDNPRSAVQAMDRRMEERCTELIAAEPELTLVPVKSPNV